MATYLLVYTGNATQPASEEEGKAVMDAWIAWFGGIGEAVVDPGNPIGPSAAVAADGTISTGAPSGVSGYSVITAASLDAATTVAKTCPHLAAGGMVEVYETFDAM
jgi:hypothetical protein